MGDPIHPTATLPPPTGPPAGWYPDPAGGPDRYFDGRTWSGAAAPTRPPHPTLPLSAAAWAIAILAGSLVVSDLVARLLDDVDLPVLVAAGLATAIGYGPSVWWAWRVARRAGGRESIGLGLRWSDLGWGPVSWAGAIATQITIGVIVMVSRIPIESNVDSSDGDITAAYVIAMIATAVVAAPIVEETIFRGVVLRGLLSRMGPALAIAVQGVIFGCAHIDPARGGGNIGLALVLSGVGCAFGVAAYWFRRIGPTIVAHAIFNGVVVTLLLTGVLDDFATR